MPDPSAPVHVACRLCGADDAEPLYEGIAVVRCRGCGMVYVDPQPSDPALEAVYGDDYYTTSVNAGEPSYMDNREGLELFFDPGDAPALAKQVRRLRKDESLRSLIPAWSLS